MKKLTVLLMILMSVATTHAQFALKGGISYSRNEIANYLITGQFHRELLVASIDLMIPMERPEDIAISGRMGIGTNGDRFRLATDIGAIYKMGNWRVGYSIEGNIRLYGPIGMFARWARTYPICQRYGRNEIGWGCQQSEISIGIVIELDGDCY